MKKLFSKAEVDHVTFTGGEPMMAERFAEVVLFTRMKNKTVSVISNGNFANLDAYKTLISLKTSLFEFPFHSAQHFLHDQMTGKDGSWQNSFNAIKFVLEQGGEVVPSIIISSVNFAHIGETIRFLESLGLKRMMLNRINIGGNLIHKGKFLIPQKQQLTEAFKQASVVAGEKALDISSNICIPFCFMDVKQFEHIRFTSCSLDIGRLPISIDIEGNIRLCNHSPINLGNIFTDEMEAILNSHYMQKWKNTIPDFCAKCNIYPSCLGGCRSASEQTGKGLTFPDPILGNQL